VWGDKLSAGRDSPSTFAPLGRIAPAEGLISAVAAEVMSPEAPAISPGPAPLEHGRRAREFSGGSVLSHQGGEELDLTDAQKGNCL
jgi:hypothetical protein